MQLGIKVGLQKSSFSDLQATQPDFCEVWFDSAKIDEYDDLFAYTKSLGIKCGLHFWGALDGILANLCFPDQKLLSASRELVKKTIDAAQKHHCKYVNVHPGGSRMAGVDFTKGRFYEQGEQVDFSVCVELLSESLTELAHYAYQHEVNLLVESVPSRAIGGDWYSEEDRTKILNLGELPLAYLQPLLDIPHLGFTNDFGHTAANLVSQNRAEIFEYLYKTTQLLASKTRLIHAGYLIPPYNGTDYHGSLYNEIFTTDLALPNYQEMKQLLKLFSNQNEIGILAEPKSDHVGNFKFLKALISESSKTS